MHQKSNTKSKFYAKQVRFLRDFSDFFYLYQICNITGIFTGLCAGNAAMGFEVKCFKKGAGGGLYVGEISAGQSPG